MGMDPLQMKAKLLGGVQLGWSVVISQGDVTTTVLRVLEVREVPSIEGILEDPLGLIHLKCWLADAEAELGVDLDGEMVIGKSSITNVELIEEAHNPLTEK